jgi:tetratricopeptide (TPR) repeat protein
MWRGMLSIFTHQEPNDDGFRSTHPPGSPAHSIDWIRGQLREIEKLTSTLCVLLGMTIAVYAVAIWVREWDHFTALISLAMCGLVAVLGIVSGGALGFLFGIPRLPPRSDRAATASATNAKVETSPYILSNSNLEEISDWLTKIIVGLGLVQLKEIPSYVGNYRGWLVKCIQFTDIEEPIGFSWFLLVVTFSAAFIGFLFFYVQTRTRMTVLFQATEVVRGHRPSDEQARDIWQDHDQFTPADRVLRASEIKPAGTIPDDAAVPVMPGPTDSADLWAAWAASQARANHLEDAALGWRMAIVRDARRDALLRERYAEVLFALNKDQEALRYFEEARALFRDKPEDVNRIRRRELLTALYLPAPDGFTKALEAANDLAKDPASQSDPWIKVWHVSALGQKHAWHMQYNNVVAAGEVAADVKKIVEEIIRLVPNADDPIRKFLRQLIDPEGFSGDLQENDLASLKSNKEIYDLITKGPPQQGG